MAPAHPHATSVAVYLALFFLRQISAATAGIAGVVVCVVIVVKLVIFVVVTIVADVDFEIDADIVVFFLLLPADDAFLYPTCHDVFNSPGHENKNTHHHSINVGGIRGVNSDITYHMNFSHRRRRRNFPIQ